MRIEILNHNEIGEILIWFKLCGRPANYESLLAWKGKGWSIDFTFSPGRDGVIYQRLYAHIEDSVLATEFNLRWG